MRVLADLAQGKGESLRSAMGWESGGIVDARQGFELRFRTVELWGELTAALDRD